MTLSGIDPATFRFVAQCLNHCTTACHHQIGGTEQKNSALVRYRTCILRSSPDRQVITKMTEIPRLSVWFCGGPMSPALHNNSLYTAYFLVLKDLMQHTVT